jgi:hypothetical protein
MWTVTAFVITLVIKFVINMLPSDTIDQMMDEQESEFLSFRLKKKENQIPALPLLVPSDSMVCY